MTLVTPVPAGPDAPGHARGLSGRVVGQLEPGEQLVLWACRRRLRDGAAPSPVLVEGFRLAFGLAFLEAGLAAFEALHQALTGRTGGGGGGGGEGGFFPLRCALVSADEQAVIALVAAAQAGEGPWLDGPALRLAGPAGAAPLRAGAVAVAGTLRRAGLALPPLAGPGRPILPH